MTLPTQLADQNESNFLASLDICLEYLINQAEEVTRFDIAEIIRTARQDIAKLTGITNTDISLTRH